MIICALVGAGKAQDVPEEKFFVSQLVIKDLGYTGISTFGNLLESEAKDV